MYFHDALGELRFQIVKNGWPGGIFPSGPGLFDTMWPIVTPKSPLAATIVFSGPQLTGLVFGGAPLPTPVATCSLPSSHVATSGPPRLIASGSPYCLNAGPMPIVCASRENDRSASARLSRYRSIVAASVAGVTICFGNT